MAKQHVERKLAAILAAPEFRTRYLKQFLVAPDEATVAPVAEVLQQVGIPN